MHLTSIFLGIIFILNLMFATIVLFLERRDAGTTWAWLLVLFFIPILGFILYLLFGQNLSRKHLFYWEDLKKTGFEEKVSTQLVNIHRNQFEFRNPSSKHNRDLIYMQLVNNHAYLSEDNSVDLFVDGRKKFEQLFKDIESANDYIHLQYYIIKNDRLGKKLIALLTEKAKTGVKVRVLYDELGSRSLPKRLFKELRAAGGQVEVFFPSKLRFINLRMNFRNHRKLVIIDGKIGYVGGFNVGDEYLGLNERFGYWRDTHLRIQGTAVDALQTRFILDWNQASRKYDISYVPNLFPKDVPHGDVGIQIVTSGPDSELEQIKNGYIKMILSAKKRIYIQTPYFIPDASILDALKIASLSGVEVNIMIPDKPDHPFVYWATLFHIGRMLEIGARVFIYKKGFIHAKTIVVDKEMASVGTANIDFRSFRLNFEVNAFLYDQSLADKLASIFINDCHDCKLLTLQEYKSRSLWIRFKESISRLLSPIL
ncbi:cardiolipin synthase [Neobacillus dielmonensis]|uniref:cardiolipin synthase n=1 Tax=Neobacillus dielmonensis TaxID=1347369 RepID=UPI0005A87B04|nr:cardiolipin synthase [Neobacillus dielmonensis]